MWLCENIYTKCIYKCMYVCTCMYTCTCMSCIYSVSWICRYMYICIPSPSRHHLSRCQRRRWQYRMLEIFVWESRGNWGRILKNIAHQRDILEPLTVFHTSVVLRAARCRTFPHGLFSVYCSRPSGCASSTTSSSICFNILSQSGSWDLLVSSTTGMGAGEALVAAGSGCKFSLAAMPWWSTFWAGSPGLPSRAPSTAVFCSHAFLPPNVRHSCDPWEKKSNMLFWREKNRDFETRELTSPPQGDHYRNGKGTGMKRVRRFP